MIARIINALLYRVNKYYTYVRNTLHTKKIIVLNNNIKVGRKSTIYYKSRFINFSRKGYVIIGNNCSIGRSDFGYHAGMPFYTSLMIYGKGEPQIIIGDNCRINGAYIHSQKRIEIGKNCVIAAGVNIIDSNGHETYSLNRTTGSDSPKEIIIGDNVWIGINATILKGTRIGNNSVISAGSVVKGDFPSNCIISGNPAKVIKNNIV